MSVSALGQASGGVLGVFWLAGVRWLQAVKQWVLAWMDWDKHLLAMDGIAEHSVLRLVRVMQF